MNEKISVEYTQMRVNNSGTASRKYHLAANVRMDDTGEITQISGGTIERLDGCNIGGFGEPELTGFSLNLNTGSEANPLDVMTEICNFLADIKAKGGEA